MMIQYFWAKSISLRYSNIAYNFFKLKLRFGVVIPMEEVYKS